MEISFPMHITLRWPSSMVAHGFLAIVTLRDFQGWTGGIHLHTMRDLTRCPATSAATSVLTESQREGTYRLTGPDTMSDSFGGSWARVD